MQKTDKIIYCLNIHFLLKIAFFFILLYSYCLSQDEFDVYKYNVQYGVFSDINLNSYTTDFKELPGVPNCCPQFQNGNGIGYSFGLLYRQPVYTNIDVSLRLGYFSLNGKLSANEYEYIIIDTLKIAEIEHSLTGELGLLGIEPAIYFRLYENFFIFLGTNIGILLPKKFEQKEELIEPANYGTFENGLRTRNEQAGTIQKTSTVLMFLSAGFSYDIPLNSRRTLYLAPEVIFSFGLNSVLQDRTWKITFIRGGLSLKYSPKPALATPLIPEKK